MRGTTGHQLLIYCMFQDITHLSLTGPKMWIRLPADIKNSTSVNKFKSALKRYLLRNNLACVYLFAPPSAEVRA